VKVIEYIGQAHIRRISARDWRLAGVKGTDVEWSWENGFGLAAEGFSVDQLATLATMPDQFVVVDMDALPARLPFRQTPALARQARVAGMAAVIKPAEVVESDDEDDDVEQPVAFDKG
jgi:hypothetical protein